MADEVKEIIVETAKKTDEEVKRHFDEKVEEVKRHVDVTAEALRSDIKAVAEGVEVANERIDRLEPLVEKVGKIEDDVEVIKATVHDIQYDLKRKADREELSALEVKLRPA